MEIHIECTYCGKQWSLSYYGGNSEIKCSYCGDRNVKVRRPTEFTKVDTYAGSLPFPEKPSEKNKEEEEDKDSYFPWTD